MRILVIGAGAVGGYFGGRLAEAGRGDVACNQQIRFRKGGALQKHIVVGIRAFLDRASNLHAEATRQSRRAATFRKLKRGHPGVGVDDDDHPLDRTRRRRGFSARASWMSRGTSASV